MVVEFADRYTFTLLSVCSHEERFFVLLHCSMEGCCTLVVLSSNHLGLVFKRKNQKKLVLKKGGGTSNVNVFGAGNNCTLVFYHTSTTRLSRVRNKKYMHRILLINTGNTKQTQSIIGMCLENRFHHWYRIILITCGNWFLYQLEFQTFETIDQKVVACDQLQLENECRLRNN